MNLVARVPPILLSLCIASPLIGNILSLAHTCLYTIDFSIYQQAIYDSFATKEANPFLTIRNIHILQDHFDPIFLLAGPWAALFNYSPYSLLVFEWLFLLSTLGVLIRYSQNAGVALLWSFLLLFNRGILGAMAYPIHPTTWAMLPMTLSIIALKEKREGLFWASTLSLFLFKEIFPLATLGLSFALMLKKDSKGLPLLLISLFCVLFNFQWRPFMLEGQSWDYSHSIMAPWRDNALARWALFPLKDTLKQLLPGIFAITWITAKKSWTKEDFFVISLWVPLFLIHAMALKSGHHYGVLISWPPVLLLRNKDFLFKDKRVLAGLVTVCLYVGFGTHKRNYQTLFRDSIHQCAMSPTKRASLKKVRAMVETLPVDKTLLATLGTIPIILRPNAHVYVIDGFSKKLSQYDFLLIGRDSRPLDKERVDQLWEECLGQNPSRILFRDDYHLLVQGPLSPRCRPVNSY